MTLESKPRALASETVTNRAALVALARRTADMDEEKKQAKAKTMESKLERMYRVVLSTGGHLEIATSGEKDNRRVTFTWYGTVGRTIGQIPVDAVEHILSALDEVFENE